MINNDTALALCAAAVNARENAYAPYSNFKVGAALLCTDGTIVTGCNVENAAYSPTNCAERTAVFSAISQGKREFCAIAVCGGINALVHITPCGVCRQVLREFCVSDMQVLCALSQNEYEATTLGELLPMSFGPHSVK